MPVATPSPQAAHAVAAYVCTEQGAAVARAFVEGAGHTDAPLRGGGLSGAARLSAAGPVARTLLTEIGNLSIPMACESVTEIRRSGADVIVLGTRDDIGTYRAIKGAGAVDYFPLPVDVAEIFAALDARAANSNDAAPAVVARTAMTVAVTGSNGGVGASLLAQNLAFLAATAGKAPMSTALVDADLRFGSVACDLNRETTPGFFEALSAPARIDDTFLTASMDRIGAHLSLYSHQAGAGQAAAPLEAALPHLVAPLRQAFDLTVLDTPREVLLRQPEMLEALDRLILVLPAGYSGVNAAARLIARLRAIAPDLPIRPVLSELRRDAGLSRKDIARTLEVEIAHTLPRADKPMQHAHRAAKPLTVLQPRSAYARAVRHILAVATQPVAANPAEAKPARGGLLRLVRG